MSTATIDSNLDFRDEPLNLAESKDNGINIRRQRFSQTLPDARSLWAYDEQEEHARFTQIQQRLIRLEAALFEDFGARLDSASVGCLQRLFVSCPSIRVPSISSGHDGILTATWKGKANEELAIRCAGNSKIHFAIVSRPGVSGAEMNRQWGTFSSPWLFFDESPVARRIAS